MMSNQQRPIGGESLPLHMQDSNHVIRVQQPQSNEQPSNEHLSIFDRISYAKDGIFNI